MSKPISVSAQSVLDGNYRYAQKEYQGGRVLFVRPYNWSTCEILLWFQTTKQIERRLIPRTETFILLSEEDLLLFEVGWGSCRTSDTPIRRLEWLYLAFFGPELSTGKPEVSIIVKKVWGEFEGTLTVDKVRDIQPWEALLLHTYYHTIALIGQELTRVLNQQ